MSGGVLLGTLAQDEIFGIWDLCLCLLLLLYVVGGYVIEKMPVKVTHESALSVIFGIVLGFVVSYLSDRPPGISFSFNIFSYVILPPIIFGAGFNCKKKMFYRYFGYISLLGVVGTILTFLALIYMPYVFHSIAQYRTFDGTVIAELSLEKFLIIGATLCCTDTVASLSFVRGDQFPRVHSIIFGESILNDVVSIIMSQSLASVMEDLKRNSTGNETADPDTGEVLKPLMLRVFFLLFTSTAVGLGFGLALSWCFRKTRELINETPVQAVAVIFIWMYTCYITAECVGCSAILSVFWCGVVTGHYAYHSLDATGQILATEASRMTGYIAEAFVFSYFGVASCTYLASAKYFSPMLILTYTGLIPLVRAVVVSLLFGLSMMLRCNMRLPVLRKEVLLVILGGMMRGVVSYALIVNYVHRTTENPEVKTLGDIILISTVLGVVLLNLLVFSGVLAISASCLWEEQMCKSIERGVTDSIGAASGLQTHLIPRDVIRREAIVDWSDVAHAHYATPPPRSRTPPPMIRSRTSNGPMPTNGTLRPSQTPPPALAYAVRPFSRSRSIGTPLAQQAVFENEEMRPPALDAEHGLPRLVPYTAPGGGQFPSDYPSGSSYPPPFDTTVGTGPLPLDGADQQQRAAGTGEGEWVPRIMRGLGSLVAMPVYPRALRRGVHRWWHDFDAKYMKPVFGGSDSTAELNDTNAQEQGEGLPGGRRREDDIDHPPTNGAPLSSDAPVPLPPPGHTNGYVPPGR